MVFNIDVDITVSKRVIAFANTKEEAIKKFEEAFKKDPFFYAKTCDSVVSHEITDINEDKE